MNRSDIKQRIDFEPTPIQAPDAEYKSAQHFDESLAEHHFTAQQEEQILEQPNIEIDLEHSLRPRFSFWSRLFVIGLLILLFSGIAQLSQSIFDAWQSNQWFSLGIAFAGGLIVLSALGVVFKEVLRLSRLRHQIAQQQTARELLSSTGHQQGRAFCEKLLQQAGLDKHHPAVAQWYASLDASQNDGEVIKLYAQIVLPIVDKQARQLINKTAMQSAVMVAASPFALVDMALVAWRSIRMINQIAKLYQVEPGYLGRIRLFRAVLINMAFAGATEWIQDSGIDWLTQDLAGRLSSRVAQGVGVGLLTSRLGVNAMTLCRPIPWVDQQRPKISEFRASLIKQLRNLFT